MIAGRGTCDPRSASGPAKGGAASGGLLLQFLQRAGRPAGGGAGGMRLGQRPIQDASDRAGAAAAFRAAAEAGIDLGGRAWTTRTGIEAGAHLAVGKHVAGTDDHVVTGAPDPRSAEGVAPADGSQIRTFENYNIINSLPIRLLGRNPNGCGHRAAGARPRVDPVTRGSTSGKPCAVLAVAERYRSIYPAAIPQGPAGVGRNDQP